MVSTATVGLLELSPCISAEPCLSIYCSFFSHLAWPCLNQYINAIPAIYRQSYYIICNLFGYFQDCMIL